MTGLTALTALGAAALAAALIPLVDMALHWRGVPRLSAQPAPPPGAPLPRLSVVVPARNEEAGIRQAVLSLLAQDYTDLELVVVNDRSTDGTGRILAELAAAHPGRLRVVTVERLPPGWLGKNHALWLGARHATGPWLLFADADVVFDPTCLRRAVGYAQAAGLDHLTLFPRLVARGYWLAGFIAFFVFAFVVYWRPWRANDPRSPFGLGIGAFNLVRRDAYVAAGTHAAIALRPDDDMRLGLRIKRLGLRQQALDGSDLLQVEWYPSLGAALAGLEKNLFAGLDYNLWRVLGALAATLALLVAPYAAVWFASGLDRWLLALALAAQGAGFLLANRPEAGRALWLLPTFPVLALLFAYALVRSTALALVRGGIRWRDTLYPLDQLRRQTGLEGT